MLSRSATVKLVAIITILIIVITCAILVAVFLAHGGTSKSQPHVIFIFVDDLGYNDLGYSGKDHGSAMKTPNIDKLAAEGVTLGNYYVQPICSPSRSQLMTGRYQIHTGLYSSRFPPPEPSCLPLDEVTLAQQMKENGYATHNVGKWHLGSYKKECLPTSRGFDTHLGIYLGQTAQFTHIENWDWNPELGNLTGYDFHEDVGGKLRDAFEYSGQYSTTVYTKRAQQLVRDHKKGDKPIFMYLSYQAVHTPFEAPDEYIEPYKDIIKDESRLKLAGMISCLDEGIANLTQTLKDEGLYDNTVIIVSTDNGALVTDRASNWPLRGSKITLWEGGIHGLAFVHSNLLPEDVQGTTSNAFIHVTDWFPTIVESLAGGRVSATKPLDGLNIWESIVQGKPSPRKELLHNIDPYYNREVNTDVPPVSLGPFNETMRAALRSGDWKILTGNPCAPGGNLGGWYPPVESGLRPINYFIPPGKNIWLYNITADPNENNDLSDEYPSVVKEMLAKLSGYYEETVTAVWSADDPNCNPDYHGGVWGPWQ